MRIIIDTVQHTEQRYPTVGDWEFDLEKRELHIRVSSMKNWKYELLVGIHELVEAALCEARNVTTQDVDDFDLTYANDDPGEDPDAPYYKEHQFASCIERLLCNELGIKWSDYNGTIESLP